MSLKTYKAFTMAEALAAVRQDLGPGAIILHTKSTKAGGILGLGRRPIVEVTARSPEDGDRQRGPRAKSAPRGAAPREAAARKAYQQVAARNGAVSSRSGPADALSGDRDRTRRLAMALAEKHEREQVARRERSLLRHVRETASDAPAPISPRDGAGQEIVREGSPGNGTPEASLFGGPPAAVARRFILQSAGDIADGLAPQSERAVLRSVSARSVAPPAGMPPSAPPSSPSPAPPAAPVRADPSMQQELVAIRDMVGQVLQRQAASSGSATQSGPDMPKRLFDMYLKMIEQDLSRELADRVVAAVRQELDPEAQEDEAVVREAVRRQLGSLISVADGGDASRGADGRPLTIALVGPTGVGKTTTLAKLAAAFKLRHRRRVGLITADTYRIAAVDQLRTYAGIIGLPLHVVMTPAEMSRAVDALRECDAILIDTAGRGSNDHDRLEELRELLAAARPHEVHLVLSSTASEKTMMREAEAFSQVGVHKIMLTKLDEAVSFGVLINVIQRVGKQLSFITTGQEVPDRIENGRAERLAELVLGGEVRG